MCFRPWNTTFLAKKDKKFTIFQYRKYSILRIRYSIVFDSVKRFQISTFNWYSIHYSQGWPGKSILCKKTPHFRRFWWIRIWVTWLLKDLDAKRLTPGQLLGCPWKFWGITLQTSYMEGRWHQNWVHTGHAISRKSTFLGKTLRTHRPKTCSFTKKIRAVTK